jgi:subtilisin-like proprotein convertase family protein
MASQTLRRPRHLVALAAAALLVSGSPSYAGTAEAVGAAGSSPTFGADVASVGPIPDGSGSRDVTFAVSGIDAPISRIRVSFKAKHGAIGDLGIYLVAPDGTTATVIERIGVGPGNDVGEGTGFGGGVTSFYATATTNLTAYAATLSDTTYVQSGDFVPQAAGGAASDITTPFTNTPANGTWRLRFVDYRPTNTGVVLGASLRISTAAPTATTSCAEAKKALAAAKAQDRKASARFAKARATFKKAKRSGSAQATKKARAVLRTARNADRSAAGQLAGATRTKKNSC